MQASGDDRRALDIGQVLAPTIEQIKTADEAERRTKNNILRSLRWAMAQSAYSLKDYAAAHHEMTALLELRETEPWEAVADSQASLPSAALTATSFDSVCAMISFVPEMFIRTGDA